MEQGQQGGIKVSFSKRKLKITALILLVLIIGAGGIFYYWQSLPRDIVINDPSSDWDSSNMGQSSAAVSYKIDYIDIKKITLKIEENNLLVRWDLNGTVPAAEVDKLPAYEGQKIQDISYILYLYPNNNINDQASQVTLMNVDTGSAKQFESWIKSNGTNDRESGQIVAGGMGNNYFVASFPLNKLGIKKNQKITFSAMARISVDAQENAGVDWLNNPEKLNGNNRYLQIMVGKQIVKPVNGMLDIIGETGKSSSNN